MAAMAQDEKTTPNTVAVLVDTSGSMMGLIQPLLKALSSLLKEQERVGVATRINLKTFNTTVKPVLRDETVERSVAVVEGSGEVFKCDGMTALNDAIISMLADMKDVRDGVVAIITDGEDNSSSYSKQSVSEAIDAAKLRNNRFVFMGANQNAVAVARNYGIDTAVNFSATPESVFSATRAVSEGVAHFRRTVSGLTRGQSQSTQIEILTSGVAEPSTPPELRAAFEPPTLYGAPFGTFQPNPIYMSSIIPLRRSGPATQQHM